MNVYFHYNKHLICLFIIYLYGLIICFISYNTFPPYDSKPWASVLPSLFFLHSIKGPPADVRMPVDCFMYGRIRKSIPLGPHLLILNIAFSLGQY